MKDSFVLLESFTNRTEASVVKSFLEANDISAFIFTDDCGGMRPWMSLAFPIRLMVNSSVLNEARELLKKKEGL